MCKSEKIKELPKIVSNQRHERNAIMKEFEELHNKVMTFLDEFEIIHRDENNK